MARFGQKKIGNKSQCILSLLRVFFCCICTMSHVCWNVLTLSKCWTQFQFLVWASGNYQVFLCQVHFETNAQVEI